MMRSLYRSDFYHVYGPNDAAGGPIACGVIFAVIVKSAQFVKGMIECFVRAMVAPKKFNYLCGRGQRL
jgi:hypothetical protein